MSNMEMKVEELPTPSQHFNPSECSEGCNLRKAKNKLFVLALNIEKYIGKNKTTVPGIISIRHSSASNIVISCTCIEKSNLEEKIMK